MPYQEVKLYQAGTFVVGNRLLDPEQRSVQARTERSNTLTSGHRACQGCGEALGARYALDAAMRATEGQADRRQRHRLPRGLLDPLSGVLVAAALDPLAVRQRAGGRTGIAAALKAKGREDIRVVGQGGDGGTLDIGFACLSGMFERNDDVLFICYDNEAYMNTGVQRSGATPPAARTANTKPVGDEPGNVFGQGKNAPLIAMAHEIPYVATATVAELRDLEARSSGRWSSAAPATSTSSSPARSAGARPRSDTIRIARLVKETGLFPVFEAEDGEVVGVSKIRRPVPVAEYLKLQRRYAHLFEDPPRTDVIEAIQAIADRNIRRFGLLGGYGIAARPAPTRGGRTCSPRPHTDRSDGAPIRPSPSRSRSTSAPASPTRPAAGAPSAPSTSTGCRPATTPARPGRTSRPGSTRPRRAARATSAPGARSWRTTRSRRSWAGSATTPARPPATGASSTRRSGSTRSSASSATRRSSRAGPSSRRPSPPASGCWSSAPGPPASRPPTT